MLRGLRFVLRESDADGTFFLDWIVRTQSVHSAVFTYIESLIVLGALQLAATASGSVLVWGVFLVAYGAQLLLTTVYARAFVGSLVSRSQLGGRWREVAFWVAGLVALAFNVWFVAALGDVLAQVIAAGLSSIAT